MDGWKLVSFWVPAYFPVRTVSSRACNMWIFGPLSYLFKKVCCEGMGEAEEHLNNDYLKLWKKSVDSKNPKTSKKSKLKQTKQTSRTPPLPNWAVFKAPVGCFI